MTLLNRANNGHVPSMMVLWRTARVFCPTSRARLETLCRPRANAGDSRMMSYTFATWRALGLFEGDDEHVRLASPFDVIDQVDTEALRTAVLELLLRPENSPTLLDSDTSDEISRASDFVRVATWALAQDPYRLASSNQDRVLEQASAQGIALFKGDGRWVSFQEWAYFVGLGVMTRLGLVMNPARAVREVLSGRHALVALSAEEDVPLTTFLSDLAKALPVVDGGAYRVRLDDVFRAKNHSFAPHQLSPALALALLQLDHEGVIILSDRPGDVATRLSLLGRARAVVRTASHIRRGTPRLAHGVATHVEGGQA
ncbi:protein DpdG [Polyangium sp. 6x1]|uniref:protein DpdG n=1 Tax=Polyangium sp. 6x1 TaxID=3042689 RepID=UPI0024829893|nr:protein DpdG [Polyangium sp. 6x1]MDI1450818.1 protein DpdG [Polyangium sp. 6x1]